MFRVPIDQSTPTFDSTFKVSFWRWLTSKAVDRKEWMRRRNEAARLAGRNAVARAKERDARWAAEKEDARQLRLQQAQEATERESDPSAY